MQLDEKRIAGAKSISWGHLTESVPIKEIIEKLE